MSRQRVGIKLVREGPIVFRQSRGRGAADRVNAWLRIAGGTTAS